MPVEFCDDRICLHPFLIDLLTSKLVGYNHIILVQYTMYMQVWYVFIRVWDTEGGDDPSPWTNHRQDDGVSHHTGGHHCEYNSS